ncbi:MAG: DUF547 domain-containing protein [Candidatus Omnitrophica bacterium]|nr:DUF547 domain-containing protein [Candidatus Omnitrophota bacterium]
MRGGGWRRGLITGICVLASCAGPVGAEPRVDHSAWDAILKRYVNGAGLVNYAAVKEDRAALDGYLASVSTVDVTSLSRDARLAFWINAYNACVIKGVLDHYPVKSVKGIKGFFDAIRYPIAGASLTLNEIEARGRALGDWRIHMALVCASSSCPVLRNEAYVPERIDEQLGDQARRFLADPSRGLRFDEGGSVLWVSKIFTWYAKDFVPEGRLTAEALVPVIAPYLDPAQAQAIRDRKPKLKFLDYDWLLNDQTAETAERQSAVGLAEAAE